jgi:hypothetical protein
MVEMQNVYINKKHRKREAGNLNKLWKSAFVDVFCDYVAGCDKKLLLCFFTQTLRMKSNEN